MNTLGVTAHENMVVKLNKLIGSDTATDGS